MIKRLFINQRAIPIPVPLLTVGDAVEWVDSTLVPDGHCITKIQLDGKIIDFDDDFVGDASSVLSDSSQLNILVDSPQDLAIQTIDALKNLISSVQSALKPIAVHYWTYAGDDTGEDLDNLCGDLLLVAELFDHAYNLVREQISYQSFSYQLRTLRTYLDELYTLRKSMSWKGLAKHILQKLEPLLVDLSTEAQSFQSSLFEIKAKQQSLMK